MNAAKQIEMGAENSEAKSTTGPLSLHRFIQLVNLTDVCEAEARLNFRCARRADSINNLSAAAYFRARATKALRVAQTAALRAGL